jgi:hypothetical protein
MGGHVRQKIHGWKAYVIIIPVGILFFGVWQMELWHVSDDSRAIAPQDLTHDDDPTEQIRKRYGLRLILSTEEGEGAAELPEGVYGFTNCGHISYPEQNPLLYRQSAKGGSNVFEVQKRQDGALYLVGYASQNHAEQFTDGAKTIRVSVSPQPSEDSFTLVEIPLSRTIGCEMPKGHQLIVQLQ